MSKIEDLVYNALEHGKRDNLLVAVAEIRLMHPKKPLGQIYEEAYQIVMNT